MDPKTQMPEIKTEVNKTDDGKKKATGFFTRLLGSGTGGGGGVGGLAGFGSAGGVGAGAVGAGGLLATKAGVLALVLIGSAVAGGIGLAGFKMFGSGDASAGGGNLSLFAPKPQQTASDGIAPVKADGSSDSLNMAAQAAAKDKEPEAADAAPVAAPADAAAGDPAKDAAAADAARRAAAGGGGAINSGGGSGAVGSMGQGLANVKKLGALSGSSGGGASTTAGSGSVGRLGDNMANASRNGASGGFSKGGAGAKASSARGVAARGGRGARAQARNVMGDQANGRAGSSFAAGRTYDGAATNSGGAIGPGGSSIGMDGVGDGTGAQPKSLAANPTKTPEEQTPPPPKANPIVTPWEKALNNAMMAVALAGALMLAASMLLKDLTPTTKAWTVTLAKWLLGLAVAAAAVALFFAGQATFGPGGQKTQGGLIMAAAGLAGGLSAYMLSMCWGLPTDGTATDSQITAMNTSMTDAGMLIKVIGGAGAVALMGAMMVPKKSMPQSEAEEKGYPTSYQAPAPQQDYRV